MRFCHGASGLILGKRSLPMGLSTTLGLWVDGLEMRLAAPLPSSGLSGFEASECLFEGRACRGRCRSRAAVSRPVLSRFVPSSGTLSSRQRRCLPRSGLCPCTSPRSSLWSELQRTGSNPPYQRPPPPIYTKLPFPSLLHFSKFSLLQALSMSNAPAVENVGVWGRRTRVSEDPDAVRGAEAAAWAQTVLGTARASALSSLGAPHAPSAHTMTSFSGEIQTRTNSTSSLLRLRSSLFSPQIVRPCWPREHVEVACVCSHCGQPWSRPSEGKVPSGAVCPDLGTRGLGG